MHQLLFLEKATLTAKAIFLGESIDLRAIQKKHDCIESLPLVIQVGSDGYAVLFRYGAVILFGLSREEEATFLQELAPHVSGTFDTPETEEIEISLVQHQSERVKNGTILLRKHSLEHLQIVAEVLAKSVVLAHYENNLATVFDRIEPFAASLKQNQEQTRSGKELLHQLGNTILLQYKMVGRVEIIDKPELLWEVPELESLYLRLEDEYEIRERHLALERKLDLISRTSLTVLELMQHRSSLRVEWYIVILILIEIVLSLYEIFIRG